MKGSEIVKAIRAGKLDSWLPEIGRMVMIREDYVLRLKVTSFMLGQRVTHIEDGNIGEVVKINVKTVGVRFETTDERWPGYALVSPNLLELTTDDD